MSENTMHHPINNGSIANGAYTQKQDKTVGEEEEGGGGIRRRRGR
jgi:hypothetical protein